jgi:hypothetical protein
LLITAALDTFCFSLSQPATVIIKGAPNLNIFFEHKITQKFHQTLQSTNPSPLSLLSCASVASHSPCRSHLHCCSVASPQQSPSPRRSSPPSPSPCRSTATAAGRHAVASPLRSGCWLASFFCLWHLLWFILVFVSDDNKTKSNSMLLIV